MTQTATTVTALFLLDGAYRWWLLRVYRLPSDAQRPQYYDSEGVRYVMVDARDTTYARLMASVGFTGDCRPGQYQLDIARGQRPRLHPVH